MLELHPAEQGCMRHRASSESHTWAVRLEQVAPGLLHLPNYLELWKWKLVFAQGGLARKIVWNRNIYFAQHTTLTSIPLHDFAVSTHKYQRHFCKDTKQFLKKTSPFMELRWRTLHQVCCNTLPHQLPTHQFPFTFFSQKLLNCKQTSPTEWHGICQTNLFMNLFCSL